MDFLGRVVQWFTTAAHWQGDAGAVHRLSEHVVMSSGAVVVAAAVALPLGVWLGHTGRGGAVAINLSNVGRAIPSFAILVIAAQVVGIGWRPAFLALVALVLTSCLDPPIDPHRRALDRYFNIRPSSEDAWDQDPRFMLQHFDPASGAVVSWLTVPGFWMRRSWSGTT